MDPVRALRGPGGPGPGHHPLPQGHRRYTHHTDLPRYLSGLGGALWTRFGRTRQQADLDQAITRLSEAIDATPPDYPDRAQIEENLEAALVGRAIDRANRAIDRANRASDVPDLEEAIRLLREAAQVIPPDHRAARAWIEENLEAALVGRAIALANRAIDRANRASDVPDLEEAIRLLREAAQVIPRGRRRERASIEASLSTLERWKAGLGNSLKTRFDQNALFRMLLRFPRRLSMGYTATFLVQIYPPGRMDTASRKGDIIFSGTETNETGRDVQLPRTQVELELSCPAIKFSPPVRRSIPVSGVDVVFWGQPVESARPGRHSGILAARDPGNGNEYCSISFTVEIADYAFDHVSRPLAGRIVTIPLGVVSVAAFAFSVVTQTQLVIGLVTSGVSGALAAFLTTRITSLYRRPSITTDDKTALPR